VETVYADLDIITWDNVIYMMLATETVLRGCGIMRLVSSEVAPLIVVPNSLLRVKIFDTVSQCIELKPVTHYLQSAEINPPAISAVAVFLRTHIRHI
jgi:hypothetical protein